MKSLLTLAIVLSSATAFATRARVSALGGAAHLKDASTVYSNPAHIFSVGDSLTIESGVGTVTPSPATTTAVTGAEALVIRSMGDAKWALSLGHDNEKIFKQRAIASSGTTIVGQQNPFELTYGMKADDMAWAATLAYSNYNDKNAGVKENTMAVKFGAATSVWSASVNLGLADKYSNDKTAVTTDDEEYKGKSDITVKGGYWLASDLYLHAKLDMGGYETSVGGTAASEIKTQDISVGAINTIKNDGNEFFYGASLATSEAKESKGTEDKITSMTLPLIIGVEANAASWLTLRGSVTQTVLINDSKHTTTAATATVDKSPADNNTKFAAGAGLKLGQLTLDGSLLTNAATNYQTLNANDLLGTVGLTYAF